MKDEANVKKGRKGKFIFLFSLVIIVIVVLIISIPELQEKFNLTETNVDKVISDTIVGKEGEVKTITESSITEIFEISELQTADYTYNAIAEVYDDYGEKIKYYVAYEGVITAGIDFSKIIIEINEDSKEIILKVPNVMIQETIVNAGTLEYIFEKDKYNTEEVFKEAYDICQKDLENRAEMDSELLKLAKINAVSVMEALVKPWIEQTVQDYKVITK